MTKLEIFKTEPDRCKFLDNGAFGEVYKLNDFHVGKFLFKYIWELLKSEEKQDTWNSFNLYHLQEEYKICKTVYDLGISVPKPEGVFMVKHPKTNKYTPSFVMEYIQGETLFNLCKRAGRSKLVMKVNNLVKEEIKKTKEANIIPLDAEEPKNIIWDHEKEKVYLVDLRLWQAYR